MGEELCIRRAQSIQLSQDHVTREGTEPTVEVGDFFNGKIRLLIQVAGWLRVAYDPNFESNILAPRAQE